MQVWRFSVKYWAKEKTTWPRGVGDSNLHKDAPEAFKPAAVTIESLKLNPCNKGTFCHTCYVMLDREYLHTFTKKIHFLCKSMEIYIFSFKNAISTENLRKNTTSCYSVYYLDNCAGNEKASYRAFVCFLKHFRKNKEKRKTWDGVRRVLLFFSWMFLVLYIDKSKVLSLFKTNRNLYFAIV